MSVLLNCLITLFWTCLKVFKTSLWTCGPCLHHLSVLFRLSSQRNCSFHANCWHYTTRNELSTDAGIPFKYRLDGSVFNLRRLQAQTKVSTDTAYELQYADDAALPSHSPSGLQDNLNALADAYHRAGLIINTKKTEILSPIQHSSPSSQLTFTVHGDTLNTTQQFTYLGSILSSDSDLTNEIQQRVKLA